MEKSHSQCRFGWHSPKGRAWLQKHFHTSADHVVRADHGKNVVRMMLDDGLTIAGFVDVGGDYYDHLATLHRARHTREHGDPDGALVSLANLRFDVVDAVPREPRCRALLPEIDREIGRAHDEVSTVIAPAGTASGPATPTARGALRSWISRMSQVIGSLEKLLLRAALSVLLLIELGSVVAERM